MQQFWRILVLSCLLIVWGGHYAFALDAKCERIVSLSPSVTDILASLDLLPNMVGITRYCTVPKDADNIRQVGGVVDTNYEAIVTLNPSIIFIQGDSHTAQIKPLKQFNYDIQALSFSSIEASINNINIIGKLCGIPEKSRNITNEIRESFTKLVGEKSVSKPKVLLFYGFNYDLYSKTPPTSAAGKSFHTELIELLGGVNVYKGLSNAPQLSQEAILHLDPDVIIILSGDGALPDFDKRYILRTENYQPNWPLVSEARAIKNGQVYVIDGFATMIPSPKAIESLAKAFSTIFKQN